MVCCMLLVEVPYTNDDAEVRASRKSRNRDVDYKVPSLDEDQASDIDDDDDEDDMMPEDDEEGDEDLMEVDEDEEEDEEIVRKRHRHIAQQVANGEEVPGVTLEEKRAILDEINIDAYDEEQDKKHLEDQRKNARYDRDNDYTASGTRRKKRDAYSGEDDEDDNGFIAPDDDDEESEEESDDERVLTDTEMPGNDSDSDGIPCSDNE